MSKIERSKERGAAVTAGVDAKELTELKELFISGILFREKEEWTSLCLQFDIAGQGKTPAEAIEKTLEAVSLYLKTSLDEGMALEETLRFAPFRYRLLYRWYTLKYGFRQGISQPVRQPLYFIEPLEHAT